MNENLKFIFASSNKGKIREMQQIAEALITVEVLSPMEFFNDYGPPPSVKEGVKSYLDNALQKASEYSKWCKGAYPILADDTGIEVNHLKGNPGVLSARFGGEMIPFDVKNSLLLEKLKGVSDRKAKFRCVLALVGRGEEPIVVDETLEGFLLDKPQGVGGFGYDPIFCPQEDNPERLSLAELKEQYPDFMTHRKKAFRSLWAKLRRP